MSEEKLTQEKIDGIFGEIKSEWDKMVKESGRSESMFIALGGKTPSNFLAYYQMAKEHVESEGLIMPELVKGLKVSVSIREQEQ